MAGEEGARPLLEVTDLSVTFASGASGIAGTGRGRAVHGVDLTLGRGEALAVVGPSGSGKSVTASALIGLVPGRAEVRGSVRFDGAELLGLPDREMSRIRGRRIGMVFQDPLAALTPVTAVGRQIAEAVRIHGRVPRAAARERAVRLLDQVGIPEAARRARAFPHEFSGGMRQRVAIAMAIAAGPELLIADEPTSALDTTVQAQILDLLDDLREESGCALLLITHDLGVVARSCDRVAVMRDGTLTEHGEVRALLSGDRPAGPGLGQLLDSTRRMERPAVAEPAHEGSMAGGHVAEPGGVPVLRVEGLKRHYAPRRGNRGRPLPVRAVDGVSLTVREGRALALLGESGCGKTTTLHEILRLRPPAAGRIEVLGHDLAALTPRARRELRHRMSVVFQDPSASLDPRMRVGDIVAEPLALRGAPPAERERRVEELLRRVELPVSVAQVRPGRLSGGQRQRVAIARALSTGPELILLDEPVSALDVPLRAGVMDLLDGLRADMGLSYVLVSHDIRLVRRSADDVAVMYLGRVVESGPAGDVLGRPRHPYTQALVDASPTTDPVRERGRDRVVLRGDPPSSTGGDAGCAFRNRCPLFPSLSARVRESCTGEQPLLREADPGAARYVACHGALHKRRTAFLH
ncbi:dipeptide ABC transporter ATP-binding protein [Streptomyces vilmorinianum]|uniref:dipeptide ABC transporter ATP-binding protein n=1 Tax=Streptomyces vilmorinianum TaxID=3051092 RepID=UPI0010FB5C04|nr:ABC transporter ATP-binding protein [Streptomyces vilmorinianum]